MKSLVNLSNLENRVSVIEQADQQSPTVLEVRKWHSAVDNKTNFMGKAYKIDVRRV
jgi:hypothetical protein